MPPTIDPLWITACNAACRVASEAWEAIRPYYRGTYKIFEKVDGPATEADRLADRLIMEGLRQEFPEPEYGYLTEESEDRLDRLECRRVWIIDPIDGTKEFIAGSGNFVMQIGLVERAEDGVWRPVVGVVYRPVQGLMYWGITGQGAWRRPWPGPECGPAGLQALDVKTGTPLGAERIFVTSRDSIETMRSVISNTHRTSRLVRLVQSLNLESYWHIGSLGVKLAIIAEGGAELYINLYGKTKEWDSAGPHVLLNEAGGRLTDLEGNPIEYNRRDVLQHNGLIASNDIIHEAVVELVQQYLREERVG